MSGFETLLIGRMLARRYRIEEVIGRGGMSVVFRARDERLDRDVALKVVSLPADTDPEIRAHVRLRLKREAHAAAGIPGHPNVVQIHDFGTDRELDLDFIVMELLRGRDLKAALAASDPPDRDAALRILREAGRGVAAGHAAGIVHRDVKPANVFLVGEDDRASVRILDFGIAKALRDEGDGDDLTAFGVRPRTPSYASPEQIRTDDRLTPASDVFQLGLVAVEALTGERAFTPVELQRMAKGESLVPRGPGWEALPSPLRTVLARALEPDPGERHPDASAWTEALAAAAEEADSDATAVFAPAATDGDETVLAPTDLPPTVPGERVDAPPPRPERPTLPTLSRKKAWIGAAAAAALLILLFLVWGGVGEPPASADAPPEAVRTLRAQLAPVLLAEAVPEEGEAAAAEVRRVVEDLNNAWLEGDLARHAGHYAPRVAFYLQAAYSRTQVREDREAARERFPDSEMTLGSISITFPAAGLARARVDKRWSFSGPEERWEGEAEQELMLELRGGAWRVTSERDLNVVRSERERL